MQQACICEIRPNRSHLRHDFHNRSTEQAKTKNLRYLRNLREN